MREPLKWWLQMVDNNAPLLQWTKISQQLIIIIIKYYLVLVLYYIITYEFEIKNVWLLCFMLFLNIFSIDLLNIN